MTDTTDNARETGNLASCGVCFNDDDKVILGFACQVHGRLADWAADNTDPKIVEKVAEAAMSHERAAATWAELTDSVADFVEGLAKKLRRGDR